ncbi:membrane progestin receptor beta-like [Saccostrea echinata]|uniref:membrane progestin receptor beta-like n=1 Tax=Saccostrea echinata TaxID=191078 RepID=UPI002A80A939|nr:membrane progestin receptor beta-like [Saccostrea echinata]
MKVFHIFDMNLIVEIQNYLKQKWCSPRDTLHVSKVPKVLREPAIFTGYRPVNRSWRYYFFSLFRVHNETFNVWSHLVGILAIFLLLWNLSDTYGFTRNKHIWPVLTFGVCAIITSMLSSVAHLFHSKSTDVHYTMFLLDYIGVTFYSYGTGVIAMYACSTKTFYDNWSQHYLPALVIACWLSYIVLCVAKCLYGENPFNLSRKLLQLGGIFILSVLLIAPLFDRYMACFMQRSCSISSLHHISICILLFALQAFFFGSHFPEKLFPGKCDILGQGHQIFHILSTITQATQIQAVIVDMESGHSDHTDPVLSQLFVYGILLMALSLLTFLYARRFRLSRTF